ncbi:MAG: DegV family protein [Halanaerobiales bacterium]|nr:DegV family protein [Halanaerobiales bacterium]
MEIGLVTDSTCDLNNNIISKYNIKVIPLMVHFGTEKFIDGVEIDSANFFKKIENSSHIPKTSKPSKHAFLKEYKKMLKEYDKIISIHVSKGLSGTYESAKLAAQEVDEDKIEVINSSSISLGLGFQVLLAAKLIKNNHKYKEIISRIKNAKDNVSCIFTVEDLTYMKEGGRIGKARAFIGSIFNINPIIEISPKTGKVNPLDKIRGNKNTLKKMSKKLHQKIADDEKAWIGIMHGDRKEKSDSLLNMTQNLISGRLELEIFKERISPTLGCHVGPSVYAFATLSGDILNI